ncbi:MAG: methyltransferase [Acidimicrobiales bacterium]
MSGLPPPPGDDPIAIRQLRQAMEAAGFDAAHVSDALMAEGPNLTPSPSHVPVLLRSLKGDDALTTLIRLFVAAVPVRVDETSSALGPLPLDKAVEMNLVAFAGDGDFVRPVIRLVPAGPMLVACDLSPDLLRPPGDVVIGVSSTSWTLAHLTFRRPVETALDVGTGCGIQAMLAAGHAARVTATDTNVRALAFARFSAALNRLDNIEFLEGDLFEPVAGRRFDLILANPPFVISPDDDYQYRDGGHVGDELSRLVLEGAGALVSPGGFAHTLVSWVHQPDGDWSERLREWTDGLGCDAWLLRFDSQDPEDYALAWNQPLEADGDLHAAAIGRWLDYYAEHGIEAIGYGAVLLRRRPAGSGRPWTRAQSLETLPIAPAGEQVRDMFAAASLLDRVGGAEGLIGERFLVDEGIRMEQVLRLSNGAFEVVEALLHLDQALPMVAEVDDFTAQLLAGLQRGLTLGEAFEEAAATLPDDVEDEDLRLATVEFVEGALERGFLHPA